MPLIQCPQKIGSLDDFSRKTMQRDLDINAIDLLVSVPKTQASR